MDKLNILDAVKSSYILSLRNLSYSLKISWAWLVLIVFSFLVLILLMRVSFDEVSLKALASAYSWAVMAIALAIFLLITVAAASVMIAWNRFIILKEKISGIVYLAVNSRTWRLIGYFLLISIIMAIAVGVVFGIIALISYSSTGQISAAMWILAMVALFCMLVWMGIRLSLILPAVSVDMRGRVVEICWRATQRNFWRLLLGSILTIAPASVLAEIISAMSETEILPAIVVLGLVALSIAFQIFGSIVTYTFYAIAFRHLIPPEDE